MRRRISPLLGALVLVASVAVPGAAASSPAEPFREPGTSKYLDTWTNDCERAGARITCVSTHLTAFSLGPTELAVCVFTETTVFNARTSRGSATSSEDGCAGPLDPAVLTVASAGTGITASLAATRVPLFECGRRKCRQSRVATVSAAGAGGPVHVVTNTGSFPDGSCYSESRWSGPTTGTLSLDGDRSTHRGETGTSDFVLQATC